MRSCRPSSAAVAAALLAGSVAAASQEPPSALERGIELYWSGRYQESIHALSPACATEGAEDERIECLEYLAYDRVALGDADGASSAFEDLLGLDPDHSLDPDTVSPKILRQFEAAKRSLVDDLFREGKDLYARERFAEAKSQMERILALEPEHPLASEYVELVEERLALSRAQAQAEEEPEPPPPPVDTDRVYHLTSRVSPPNLLVKVDPEYPIAARRAGREGAVVIAIIVDRDGTVRETKVLRSVSPEIDRAAIDAVRRWRYRPARLEGQAVAVHSVVQLNFELSR